MNQRVRYPTKEWRLPAGRLVRGSLTDIQTKDHKNNPLPPEKHHYWIAIACPKSDPATIQVWNELWQHTAQHYSQVPGSAGVMQQINLGLGATAFAWKIDDGDTDPKWSQRDGCKGCLIFQMSTTYPIACFDNANAQLDPAAIKLGDHVDAYISAAINGETGSTAGIFINPRGVRWLSTGPRITVGPDANTMFGAAVGTGYVAPAPSAGPMSGQVMGQTYTPSPGAQNVMAAINGLPAPHPSMPQMTPAPAGAPGVAGGAPGVPGHYGAAPSPANMSPPAAQPMTAEQVAAQYGVPHHPGWRYDPLGAAQGVPYVPDTGPTYAPPASAQVAAPAAGQYQQPLATHHQAVGQPGTPMQPAGGATGAYPSSPGMAGQPPLMHAAAPAAPGGAPQPPAPSVAAHGQPATAYPGSQPQYGPGNPPPGVVPNHQFVQGR